MNVWLRRAYTRAVESLNLTPFSLIWRSTIGTETGAAECLYRPRLVELMVARSPVAAVVRLVEVIHLRLRELAVDVNVICARPCIFSMNNY
jgi:hypothetical protein